MAHVVVDFLRENSVKELEKFGIYARWSVKNPRKLSLNYDQIEAVDGHALVNACRGLVLRRKDWPVQDPESPGDFEVIAQPFPRFYNYGSGHAPELDWSTATYFEKCDGTLCIVYWDSDLSAFSVATRSVPDADVSNPGGQTFSEMFWNFGFYRRGSVPAVQILDKTVTYLFELVGPGNQIGPVVYNKWDIYLLSRFETATGVELGGVEAPWWSLPTQSSFKLPQDCVSHLSTLPGTATEGFVVRDAQNNRVKIKSRAYLDAMHVMSSANSDVACMRIALSGTLDDVEMFLPKERTDLIRGMSHGAKEFFEGLEHFAGTLKGVSNRKEAAQIVQSNESYSGWIGEILDIWTGRNTAGFNGIVEAHKNRGKGVLLDSFVERVLRSQQKLVLERLARIDP